MLLHTCVTFVICYDDNALCCTICATSYFHDTSLIKLGRYKSAKKIQGAAPAWLREVQYCVGMRYFCPNCITSLDHTYAKPNDEQDAVITALNVKVTAIDNKVDLLLSTLTDSAQQPSEVTDNADATTVPAKPLQQDSRKTAYS